MSRKLRQIISSLLMACVLGMLLPGSTITSFAAGSLRISFTDPTVTVGEDVSVTVKVASTDGTILGDTKTLLSYDAALLEYVDAEGTASGGAGTLDVRTPPAGKTEMQVTLRFKALQAGSAAITITSVNAYNNDGEFFDNANITKGNSTVTINPLSTSSADATLQSLQISPGSLSPAFTPQTEAYQMTVGLDTEKLTVSAKANNDGATVQVSGAEGLQEGENTIVCTVTAEDGVTTKDYTITVNKVAGGELAPETGESGAEEPEPEILATVTTQTKELRIIPLDEGVEIPKGFKESKVNIGDVKVTGWIWSGDETTRYCVLYGMNENGEKGFYRYDLGEKTVQRYFEDPNANMEAIETSLADITEEYNSLLRDYRMRTFILIAVSIVAVLLLILFIVSMSGRKNAARVNHAAGRPHQEEPEAEQLSTYVPVSSGSRRKMSREEKYMLGEEDVYEEYEEVDADDELADYEAAVTLEDEERALESSLAEAAAENVSDDEDDDDDFEIFDL